MDTLYALVHRTAGPLVAFPTPYEAGREMARVLMDEPDWLDELSLDRFDVVVAEPSERVAQVRQAFQPPKSV